MPMSGEAGERIGGGERRKVPSVQFPALRKISDDVKGSQGASREQSSRSLAR
jgi:hypothetical protein